MNAHDLYRRLRRQREFTVTADHIALLRRGVVTYHGDEWGAPGLDPVRPYGNSNLLEDIAGITCPDWENWEEDQREDYLTDRSGDLQRLHAEVAVALEICLQRAEFTGGRYRRTDTGRWEPDDRHIRFGNTSGAPIVVTAYDPVTGATSSRQVQPGDYAVVCAAPCRLHDAQVDQATGTHRLTITGHRAPGEQPMILHRAVAAWRRRRAWRRAAGIYRDLCADGRAPQLQFSARIHPDAVEWNDLHTYGIHAIKTTIPLTPQGIRYIRRALRDMETTCIRAVLEANQPAPKEKSRG